MGLLQVLGIRSRDAPAITDSVRDSGQTFMFGKADSGERVDEKSAMQIATVYACVRLLAETVAGLPLHLYRSTDSTGMGKERAADHPLYRLLYRQPNPEMTSFSFRETMMTHLLLWGNAYAQIIRDGKNNVLSLYPLAPDNVEVDRDEKGRIYYIYHAYTDEVPGKQNRDVYFRTDEIFHVPGLGFNGLVGFSPIAMMKNSLGTTLAVEKYGSAFFKNGAQPSGVLEHSSVLKNPEKIRENWSDVYGGANNAHKVAVLEEGMQYKAISLPPEDSQFLSTRQFGVNEICRIFRVPPHMVQDLEHATFSNIEHQSIDFVVHTLTPWLVRFEQAIIKDLLLPEEQDTLFPKFNADGLLRGDYQSRMQGYATGISNGFNDGLGDFQHIGLVVSVNPLRIIHASTGTMCVTTDTKIGKWKYWGWLKDVAKEDVLPDIPDEGGEEPMTTKTAQATVTAPSGSTVNLRVKPSSNAPLVERIPIGTVVDVLGDSGSWTKVKAQGKTGYMMTVFLAPITEEEDDFETGGTLEERIARLEERVAYRTEGYYLGRVQPQSMAEQRFPEKCLCPGRTVCHPADYGG